MKCPNCGGSVVPYEGTNRHKVGTAWCETEGERVRAVVADVPEEQGSDEGPSEEKAARRRARAGSE